MGRGVGGAARSRVGYIDRCSVLFTCNVNERQPVFVGEEVGRQILLLRIFREYSLVPSGIERI